MPDHRRQLPADLAREPDERSARAIWLTWAAATAVLAGAWFAAPVRDGVGAISWLVKAPLVGLYLWWPLRRGAGLAFSLMRQAPLADWHGSYHEFDGVQIRVLIDDQDCQLIAAADVLDALRITGRDRQPGRIRAIAGGAGLVSLHGTRQLFFTDDGLQRWLERSSRRDVVRFAHWFGTQVREPRRRFQERGTRQ